MVDPKKVRVFKDNEEYAPGVVIGKGGYFEVSDTGGSGSESDGGGSSSDSSRRSSAIPIRHSKSGRLIFWNKEPENKTKNVDRRPSETKKPEELKNEEGTIYKLLDGKLTTYVFPNGKGKDPTVVELKDGDGNANGTLSIEEYLNRGAELTFDPRIGATLDLCSFIMSVADTPGSNVRKNSCYRPFCLCQLSVAKIRSLLRTASLAVPCMRDFLRKRPSKDALCIVFDLLYDKGVLSIDYPFRNYYSLVQPDPFFGVTLDYWDRAVDLPVAVGGGVPVFLDYDYSPYDVPFVPY